MVMARGATWTHPAHGKTNMGRSLPRYSRVCKEFGVSALILYNLTGFVIKALWKPLFYGERHGIVLSVIIHY